MAITRTPQDCKTSGEVASGTIGETRIRFFEFISMISTVLVITLGFAAVLLSIVLTAKSARPGQAPVATAQPSALDPSRFILNALLVPALDGDAVPLRWVDPRGASLCGPDTVVRVNREPLLAGALVPDTPFELEWRTDGCRPFGAYGPRFDGGVRLTVFREDWGFSAMVEPSGLRVALSENETILIRPGAASMPQSGADESAILRAVCAGRPLECR